MPRYCIVVGCNIRPSYGLIGQKPIHCSKHKTNDEIDLKHKRCVIADCDTQPTYGLIGQKPIHCSKHKTNDEIDLVNKRCIVIGCDTQPAYGLIGQKPIHCSKHKTNDEIDLRHKRCIVTGCNTQPSYGLIGQKQIHCLKHKTNDEIDLVSKRCIVTGCNTQPSYGLIGQKPMHCLKHKTNDEIDLVNKRCITCNATQVNHKFKPNCARCHYYINPNDPHIRNYKTREQAFMLPLKEKYPNMILDKIISGGCSKRRPDGFIDCLTHVVIVEIDEDQHIGYDQSCDNRRTMEIFRDIGHRSTVFVRLNPDGYIRDNKRIGKCFTLTKSGEMKKNNKEFNHRFEVLCNAVELAIKQIPTCEVSYNQLFFNDE